MATGELIYAFRVMRLPLLDAGGQAIGRIEDLVVVRGRPGQAPRVVGFVAESQRRRIFVSAGRINELDSDGARLRSWDVDLDPFTPRRGEVLIGQDLIDSAIGDETVSDVGLRWVSGAPMPHLEIAKIRLARRSALRRRPSYRLVDYDELPSLFAAPTEMEAEAARLRDMHPSEVAAVVRALPAAQRSQLAEAMDDERLADVLEELPESEQIRIVERLDLGRLVSVLEEMELDDLADLLGEMTHQQRTRILAAMDEEDADTVRHLLSFEAATAGGLMTPQIIVLGPKSTVADALAAIRDPHRIVSVAVQVFVCQAPFKPPTGRFLGTAHVQRLLREAPRMELERCISDDPAVTPETPDREVAELLASYDMVAIAVCDAARHLLGAITIDDVLDRMLGAGWRLRHHDVKNVS